MTVHTRCAAAAVALGVALGVVAGAAPGMTGSAAPAGAAVKVPNLLGTWAGDYRYPSPDLTAHATSVKVVIDQQDGQFLWGHDEFIDKTGALVSIPVLGSFEHGDRTFGLSLKGGLITGRVLGARRLATRFFIVGDNPTSFHVTLRKAP
ncbi:MAG: hypothetical protein WCI50_01955 [Actinomycetes bacterium]